MKGRTRAKPMNNPNPFHLKGSLLDNQSQRRSRLKLGVSCVLAVSVVGLVAMLIGGCKRGDTTPPDIGVPAPDTNTATSVDTNLTPVTPLPADTNTPAGGPPAGANQASPQNGVPPQNGLPPQNGQANNVPAPLPPTPPVPPATMDTGSAVGGSEYTVVKGDSLAKIAKKTGVSRKALQDANPNVVPAKLKIGQKLVIPAGGKSVAPAAPGTIADVAPTATGTAETSGSETYTVKSGDTLTKIAKAHGTTVKAIQKANHLTTTAIKVGKKLKIPVKGAATSAAPVAPTAPAPPAVPDTAPSPVVVPPPVNNAPAPGAPAK